MLDRIEKLYVCVQAYIMDNFMEKITLNDNIKEDKYTMEIEEIKSTTVLLKKDGYTVGKFELSGGVWVYNHAYRGSISGDRFNGYEEETISMIGAKLKELNSSEN